MSKCCLGDKIIIIPLNNVAHPNVAVLVVNTNWIYAFVPVRSSPLNGSIKPQVLSIFIRERLVPNRHPVDEVTNLPQWL